MTSAAQKRANVLDPAQLVRIEAVHRGFLFQHLYTVQCLLSAASLSARRVEVENDEDVEVQLDGRCIYIQVKHRKGPLAWNDIEEAMARFGELRSAHERGERHGDAAFLIVSNAAPNGPLAAKLAAADWPVDVRIDWPAADPDARILPAPKASLLEAAEAAYQMAEGLPFATLAPETLVWKLAGLVSLAATGDAMGQPSPFARIHALKFYDLARAPESLFRVGQDLVDQFISMRDFDGALQIMDTIILPQLRQWKPADYMITVRSQYAVVLAYCRRFADAEAEMARLEPYKAGLPSLVQKELESQRELIAQLRRYGPPPQRLTAPLGSLSNIAKQMGGTEPVVTSATRSGGRKIGRNERCPCGSGKKFKHCHGRRD